MEEQVAKDGVSPAWQVFEWYVVEGLVRTVRDKNAIAGLPGQDKFSRAINESPGQPIKIFLPYVAETQDEKMYRVVMDRERWFNVVMGETYTPDYQTSEKLAARMRFPEAAAEELRLRHEVDTRES